MIEIKGFQPSSFIDWEGRIAVVVFLAGCNFRCPFCQNWELIIHPQKLPSIPFEEVKDFLGKHSNWVEGVVIGGGEPTIHPDLPSFLREIRKLSFPIKLDTNGSNLSLLTELVEAKLIDCVAMDIKAPLEEKRYNKLAGKAVDVNQIKKSIRFLQRSKIDYELRTTMIPTLLNEKDVKEISKCIAGAKKFVLQSFEPKHAFKRNLRKTKPYSKEELGRIAASVKEFVKNTTVR